MEKKVDVAILGAGPAGLTAGLYCKRFGLNVLVISRELGGSINYAHKIENFPAFSGSGVKLMKKFYKQCLKQNVEFLFSDIISIKKESLFEITTRKEIVKCKAVIIALGLEKKRLKIKNEDKFLGKGVSYCTLCDAPFFKDKIAAVIGCGNSAFHSALYLNKIAKKVYLICYKGETKADKILKDKVKKSNIKMISNANAEKILGDNNVKSLIINKNGQEEEIAVDGIFIEIGSIPNAVLLKELNINLDKDNYIAINEKMQTSIEGVFAAGDITNNMPKQISTAVGEGAKSAFYVDLFLKK